MQKSNLKKYMTPIAGLTIAIVGLLFTFIAWNSFWEKPKLYKELIGGMKVCNLLSSGALDLDRCSKNAFQQYLDGEFSGLSYIEFSCENKNPTACLLAKFLHIKDFMDKRSIKSLPFRIYQDNCLAAIKNNRPDDFYCSGLLSLANRLNDKTTPRVLEVEKCKLNESCLELTPSFEDIFVSTSSKIAMKKKFCAIKSSSLCEWFTTLLDLDKAQLGNFDEKLKTACSKDKKFCNYLLNQDLVVSKIRGAYFMILDKGLPIESLDIETMTYFNSFSHGLRQSQVTRVIYQPLRFIVWATIGNYDRIEKECSNIKDKSGCVFQFPNEDALKTNVAKVLQFCNQGDQYACQLHKLLDRGIIPKGIDGSTPVNILGGILLYLIEDMIYDPFYQIGVFLEHNLLLLIFILFVLLALAGVSIRKLYLYLREEKVISLKEKIKNLNNLSKD